MRFTNHSKIVKHVKSFSGAKISDMQDYVKPTLRENPDQTIVHVGTNDLASNNRPKQIVDSIIGKATCFKSGTCDVFVSSITVRKDQHRKKVDIGKYSFKGVM